MHLVSWLGNAKPPTTCKAVLWGFNLCSGGFLMTLWVLTCPGKLSDEQQPCGKQDHQHGVGESREAEPPSAPAKAEPHQNAANCNWNEWLCSLCRWPVSTISLGMMMCLLPAVQKNSAMHRMTFPWMKAVTSNTHRAFIAFPFTCSGLITMLHAFVLLFKSRI